MPTLDAQAERIAGALLEKPELRDLVILKLLRRQPNRLRIAGPWEASDEHIPEMQLRKDIVTRSELARLFQQSNESWMYVTAPEWKPIRGRASTADEAKTEADAHLREQGYSIIEGEGT